MNLFLTPQLPITSTTVNLPVTPGTVTAPATIPLHDVFDINSYLNDGFKKVCNVVNSYKDGKLNWRYANIDHSLMFSDHASWIYFIVWRDEIMKCGETGNPLGMESTTEPGHPRTGTMARLSRYMNHGDTDLRIREDLEARTAADEVSIWAKKCDYMPVQMMMYGNQMTINYECHKELEQVYLHNFVDVGGRLPVLNLCKK